MQLLQTRKARLIVCGVLGVVLLGSLALVGPRLYRWGESQVHAESVNPESAEGARTRRLDEKTLVLSPQGVRSLGVKTLPASSSSRELALPPMAGCLALDNNQLLRVHPRFPGEIVALGTANGYEYTGASGEDSLKGPPLKYGDSVKKGQVLAVLWSKDLGEKKSELVDAVSRLRLDREVLSRLQPLLREGATSERSVREAERAVEADLIAVARAERTLRSWRVSEAEIRTVHDEAERLSRGEKAGDPRWARVEIVAAQDGVILEKNVALGDIVDTTTDLFKIGDLTRLAVWVHVYEDDLPTLLKVPRPIRWTVKVPSQPGLSFSGTLESVGAIIDPNQHTALVSGHVDNTAGQLRVGQFVTATLQVPAPADEIEIPASALVEDGHQSLVFVQPDPNQPHFEQRQVSVARRYHDRVYVHRVAPLPGCQPIQPGEHVVVGGAVLLRDALAQLPVEPKVPR